MGITQVLGQKIIVVQLYKSAITETKRAADVLSIQLKFPYFIFIFLRRNRLRTISALEALRAYAIQIDSYYSQLERFVGGPLKSISIERTVTQAALR